MTTEKAKIFCCYSRVDSEFALKLTQDLRQAGANMWIDQRDIAAGEDWDTAIGKALEACECLLIILSPSSVQSREVLNELNYALKKNKRIVPVLYQACEIPYRLDRLQYVDFRGIYDQAFSKLLNTLGIVEQAEQKTSQPAEKRTATKASPTTRKRQEAATTETKVRHGKVVYDAETDLTWQQSGSDEQMTFKGAEKYVRKLNGQNFAGYNDWRLPTLVEANALIRPEKSENGLYINPIFDKKQKWIWCAEDERPVSVIYIVDFLKGAVGDVLMLNLLPPLAENRHCYVRAVR